MTFWKRFLKQAAYSSAFDPDNSLKLLLIGLMIMVAPFMLIIAIIGAVCSSVGGFFSMDISSLVNFNPDEIMNSPIIKTINGIYDEWQENYTEMLMERKAEVEKEYTTTEYRPADGEETPKPETPADNASRPVRPPDRPGLGQYQEVIFGEEDGTGKTPGTSGTPAETETEEPKPEAVEICTVNVIVTTDDYPLFALMAWYNLYAIRQTAGGILTEETIREQMEQMLGRMASYTETPPSDDSDDYIIAMEYADYKELPELELTQWGLGNEEYEDFSARYYGMTQMFSEWLK